MTMVKAIENTAITGKGPTFTAGKFVFARTQQVVFHAARNNSCCMKHTCRSLVGSGDLLQSRKSCMDD
ncbi:MAG: hypothetical protein LBL13_12875 [Bacteroidales bacterium]|nr:hypothetical protein [Bacteroidales bacterium]